MSLAGVKRGPYKRVRKANTDRIKGQVRKTQIAMLRRQGHSWDEIAKQTRGSKKTCMRLFKESVDLVSMTNSEEVQDLTLREDPVLPNTQQQAALDLRLEGMSYREIAAALGIGHETARRYVDEGLHLLQDEEIRSTELARTFQVARYERLLKRHFPNAVAGDDDATKTVLKILEQENKLLGLNAPQQIDITEEIRILAVEVGVDAEELIEMSQDIAAQITKKRGARG